MTTLIHYKPISHPGATKHYLEINLKRLKPTSKIYILIQSVFIAYALTTEAVLISNSSDYKSKFHYLYAQVTMILGNFNLNRLLLAALSFGFIYWFAQKGFETFKGFLPFFFSFCLLIGESYSKSDSWDFCFSNPFVFMVFLLRFFGYSFLFEYLLAMLLKLHALIQNSDFAPKWVKFLFEGEKNSFLKVFFLLLIVWAPIIILSYPGNVCWDFYGQLYQSLGLSEYSSHHPLLHTFISGSIIKFGRLLTGSLYPGLFLYIIFQAIILALALAGTIARLTRRNSAYLVRLIVTAVYVLSPMYSNMVSTAIKDIPFMAVMLWYILVLEELWHDGISQKKAGFFIKLVLVQLLLSLLRNNGVYVFAITGIIVCVTQKKKLSLKNFFKGLLSMVAIPVFLYVLASELLLTAFSASRGGIDEMLSIPFQQTARYVIEYGDTLTPDENTAIEAVLGNTETIAERYDPDISDPVKALFNDNAAKSDLLSYLSVWFKCFFKHPDSYLQAFITHIYGWYDPGVANEIRYEADNDMFSSAIPGADKLLVYWYRFLSHFNFLELLENPGIYTWLLFVTGSTLRKKKDSRQILLIPLYVSLLVCMASPGFYMHPRYAYPIMFTIPFLCGASVIKERSYDNA